MRRRRLRAVWIALALCAVVFWLAIFFTFFHADEEAWRSVRPQHKENMRELGVWSRRSESEDGSYEEERFVMQGRKVFRQVRRRSATGEIVEVIANQRAEQK